MFLFYYYFFLNLSILLNLKFFFNLDFFPGPIKLFFNSYFFFETGGPVEAGSIVEIIIIIWICFNSFSYNNFPLRSVIERSRFIFGNYNFFFVSLLGGLVETSDIYCFFYNYCVILRGLIERRRLLICQIFYCNCYLILYSASRSGFFSYCNLLS
ncbi:hypothetical protein PPERSA_10663 [Pseudocohnilembus persalinus]|uniref:Uncharacterized protein n=1 Tax=Pseudocohnilembus persalinus TaxID=266149 RepID=A0A0V0QD78_PSEPJ|nr:hypothetical protein PPERSA_10663 [Pseudocohnilembus persalinus]|eukprot:KRX00164.1 hypothetical protein PPERSA_10663 [Pseudocohnilembus persalinus]